ncbi:MAG: hypothetical protein MNPFHGCM_02665 [Gemmatimonadaceae bacterium]|nr:hypothetical protein [Gemmatimonadaceae bacterium]
MAYFRTMCHTRCQSYRVFIAAAVLGVPRPAWAQHPDFSGQWVAIVDSAAGSRTVASTGDAVFRSGDMGSGWGAPLTIRQAADSLIVEYPQFSTYDLQPPLRFAFSLDGGETRAAAMIGHAQVSERSRVSWSGDTLVVVTTFPVPPAAGASPTTAVRRAMSLAADGTLHIETRREGAAPVRTAYRKR